MTEIDLSRAEWHKSSYSGQSGNCVAVARNLPGLVAILDSKSPDGPNLLVSPETWQAFLLTLLRLANPPRGDCFEHRGPLITPATPLRHRAACPRGCLPGPSRRSGCLRPIPLAVPDPAGGSGSRRVI